MKINELLKNSTRIFDDVFLVKSAAKEARLLSSDQIWRGGSTIVVKYGSTRYVKITDGSKTFSDLPKLGQGGGGATWGGITGTLSNQTDLNNALSSKANTSALAGYVPTSRTVNGKALSANIDLTNTDVDAAATSHTHDAGDVTSGTFDDARIPNLNASKINAGTLADARIPNLNASKTNAGTFDAARIPDLATSKITGLDTALAAKSNNLVTVVGESGSTLNYGSTHIGLDKLVRTTGGGNKTHNIRSQANFSWPDGSIIQGCTPSSELTITVDGGVNLIADKSAPWVIQPNTMYTISRLGSDEWIIAAKFMED